MADIAAVLDTAGLSDLRAGGKVHGKGVESQVGRGFASIMQAHVVMRVNLEPASQEGMDPLALPGTPTLSVAVEEGVVEQGDSRAPGEGDEETGLLVVSPPASVEVAALRPSDFTVASSGFQAWPGAQPVPDSPSGSRQEPGRGMLPVMPGSDPGEAVQSRTSPASSAGLDVQDGQLLPWLADSAAGDDAPVLPGSTDGTVMGGSVDTGSLPSARSDPLGLRPFEAAMRQAEGRLHASLESPVRSPAFARELGEKVVWFAGRNVQTAEMTLNPPQLGTLEIRLTVSGGEAGAQFYSPSPVVREALEAALPKLRETLSQAGLQLGEANVRDQSLAQGRDARQPGAVAAVPSLRGVSEPEEPVLVVRRPLRLGLVDLYA